MTYKEFVAKHGGSEDMMTDLHALSCGKRCVSRTDRKWMLFLDERISQLIADIELLQEDDSVYADDRINTLTEIILEFYDAIAKNHGEKYQKHGCLIVTAKKVPEWKH